MQGSGFNTILQNGEYGNLCAEVSNFTLNDVAANEKIFLFNMLSDSLIVELALITEDMGAGVTMKVGFDDMTGWSTDDQFIKSVDVSAEGKHEFEGFSSPAGELSLLSSPGPIKLGAGPLGTLDAEKIPVFVTVEGAVASGKISCVVKYIYLGTK